MADSGQRVGDYEILAPLGTGGMGRVFKVRNVISNREEAMKILLPDFAADPDLAARFMAEIRTLAGLEHPGIAQLRTAFQYQNQFVMVMEYVEGTTLEKLATQTRIPLDHVVDYSTQVLAALSYAHAQGVTHRDIKPANIMITTHGLIKLMDFGIAKSTDDMQLTRPGTTMGSVYYMSPEQVRGGTVDARTDIYSFGVTLYEMLTGRKPFQADTSYTVLNAQLNQAPTPPLEFNPSIPPELNSIVLRAMAKQPGDRFQSADEFRSALKALREPQAEQIPQVASPVVAGQGPQYGSEIPQDLPSPPPPFTPVVMPPPPANTGKTHRGLWIGLGAVTAILALIAVASLLPRIFSTQASPKPAVTSSDTATPPQSASVPQSASDQQPATGQQPPPSVAASSQLAAAGRGTPKPSAGAGTPSHAQNGSLPQSAGNKPREPYVSPASAATPNPAAGAGSPATPAAGPSPAELREARDRYAGLEARANAALTGVEQIRNQQQAQGVDLQGDVLVAMNRLHHQLDEARRALNEKDLETANDYMSRAENDAARLEKFLGR
jgi:serine/threonine-protein kinase